MIDHEVGQCNTLTDFIDGINQLLRKHKVTGMAVTLCIQDGQCYTTHQFGFDTIGLEIASSLMADYAKGLIIDHKAN